MMQRVMAVAQFEINNTMIFWWVTIGLELRGCKCLLWSKSNGSLVSLADSHEVQLSGGVITKLSGRFGWSISITPPAFMQQTLLHYLHHPAKL
jgi:hypothetical protein